MKMVYICSPYRGEPPHTTSKKSRNLNRASRYSREIATAGALPIAPHLFYASFLDDKKDQDRKTGMEMGRQLLALCDEVHVYGEIVSEGMAEEIQLAELLNIPIIYKT